MIVYCKEIGKNNFKNQILIIQTAVFFNREIPEYIVKPLADTAAKL